MEETRRAGDVGNGGKSPRSLLAHHSPQTSLLHQPESSLSPVPLGVMEALSQRQE